MTTRGHEAVNLLAYPAGTIIERLKQVFVAANTEHERIAGTVRLDLAGNRRARKYSQRQQVMRVLWTFGVWLVRLSPRPCFGWRRFVLRLFGARIGKHVHIYASAKIYMPWNLQVDDWAAIGEDAFIYNLGRVHIAREATVSYRAHLCAGTHDFADPRAALVKTQIEVGARAWIGTDAFIGPNVRVGEAALVGARAVCVKDVAPHAIVAGNPAQRIGTRNLEDCDRTAGSPTIPESEPEAHRVASMAPPRKSLL